jgi:hypothetical protein
MATVNRQVERVVETVRETGSDLLRSGIGSIQRAGRSHQSAGAVQRSLTIGRPAEELQRLWDRPETRTDVLEGAEASASFSPAPGDWGTVATLTVRGGNGMASRLKLGRALRRFKSLAETGEIPTLEHNPSARPGPGDKV